MSITAWLANATPITPDSLTISYQINKIFETLVGNLGNAGDSLSGIFVTDIAMHIAAICVLLYLGYELWPVIMGRKAPDITKLLRPIMIAVILEGWPFFYLSCNQIKNDLARSGYAIYRTQQNGILLAEQTIEKKIYEIDSIHKNNLAHLLAENQTVETLENASYTDEEFKDMADEYIQKQIEEAKINRLQGIIIGVENFIFTIIEDVLKWLGQIYLYIFFAGMMVVGNLGTIILGMFGPIAFALSISDSFKNLWAKWINNFVTLALYPFIAYIAMAYVTWIVRYFLEVQVNLVTVGEEDWWKVVSFTYGHFGILISYLIALFTGGYVMKAVPEMAKMAFNGIGGNDAANAGAFLSGMAVTSIGGGLKLASGAMVATAAGTGAAAGELLGAIRADDSREETDRMEGYENDGSKDPVSKYSSSMDAYANYKPHQFNKKTTKGQSIYNVFGYKRKSKNATANATQQAKNAPSQRNDRSPKYSPELNNKNKQRGKDIKLEKYWTERNLNKKKAKSFVKQAAKAPFSLMTAFIMTEMDNPDLNAWSNTMQGAKKSIRDVAGLGATFHRHYKKHQTNGTFKAINKWQKERKSDIVFVRRPGIAGGYYYQTYGNEALKMAALAKEPVKFLKIGNNEVAYFTLYPYSLQPVIHKLTEMGLSVNVINNKGKSIYYKQDIGENKKQAISRIKTIIGENQGVKFNKPLKGIHTEATGDGLGYANLQDKPTRQERTIRNIVFDVFGALHVTTADQDGHEANLYLDRLTAKDLNHIAKMLENTTPGDTDIITDGNETTSSDFNGYTFIEKIQDDNTLDDVYDEEDFSYREKMEYEQKAHANSGTDNITDLNHSDDQDFDNPDFDDTEEPESLEPSESSDLNGSNNFSDTNDRNNPSEDSIEPDPDPSDNDNKNIDSSGNPDPDDKDPD